MRGVPDEEKKRLRRVMREAQRALPEEYVLRAGERIEARLLALPQYRRAQSIFLYISMEKEPSTRRVLSQALQDGKRVYVPKCVNRGEMLAIRLDSLDDLAPGSYGIPEPRTWTETAEAEELDLILVPCVCASPDGKRLGHGGGYYDRFLRNGAENAVCLCFHEMLQADIPMAENDVSIPAVLTEKGLFP